MSSLIKKLMRRNIVEAGSGRGLFSGIREQKGSARVGPLPALNLLQHAENLSEFENVYRRNAVVNAAINNLVDMIVGVGYYTEAEDSRAKEVVDEYAEEANLDGFLRVVCRNMLIFGFAPVERWWNSTLQLKPLPPQTVYVEIDRKGYVVGYKQKTWMGEYIDFKIDEIIWFAHNASPGNPYGVGLIEPIYTLIDYKQSILEDICKIVHRYASPLNIWITRGSIADLKTAVENREPDEDIFIGRAAPEDIQVKTLEMDPRGRYVDYLEVINQEIYECLQAPLLTYLKNATEASANVQLDVIKRHVEGVQRYIKRVVEKEVFRPLVEKAGLSEVPRIRWGKPSTGVENLTVKDVATLVQAYVLTNRQAVDLLRKMGLPIEESKSQGE
ncbi:hypothetical protein J7L27_07680 [Candidatus Bathyarchaeota archaeon]|nr:hypothetical protein [Candidatus Bathyarchaeota archaeon]